VAQCTTDDAGINKTDAMLGFGPATGACGIARCMQGSWLSAVNPSTSWGLIKHCWTLVGWDNHRPVCGRSCRAHICQLQAADTA